MNLGIFVGTYMDQKLDSKGRLSVPAKWRERLGTEFFMVCMNLRGSTCIKLYPQDEFMHCVEALDDGTANEVYEKNKNFLLQRRGVYAGRTGSLYAECPAERLCRYGKRLYRDYARP